jgi:hypothetical protein
VKIGQSVQQEKSFTINSAEIGVVLMRQRASRLNHVMRGSGWCCVGRLFEGYDLVDM